MPENAPGAGTVSAWLARSATALAVLGVATIAAIVSYTHVEGLALGHGYTLATARLLPFSVDGLIFAASMAHATGTRPALARTSLILGVLATIAANVVFGARHGLTGEVISAWPAVAFLLASEILVGMLKAPPVTVLRAHPVTVTGDVTEAVSADVTDEVTEAVPVTVLQGVPGGVNDGVLHAVPEVAVPVTDAVNETAPAPAPRPARPAGARRNRKAAPEHVFAAELAAGQVPSLRAVKERCRVGTPRAREILAELVIVREVPQAA
jgi:hypothetical protein